MSSNRTNDDELEMNLLNIDTNTYDHIDSTQIQTPRTGDRISIEISTLLSPNSQPEIMFIEELLCFIAKSSKSTCAGDDGRGDSTAADAAADGHTISNESRIRKSKTWIEELEEKLKSRRDNLKATSFAHKLNKMSFQTIAFNRLPAILSTITLEMGVTVVISSFSTLIQKHMLIAAFFPVLSAIAGNIGLQSSTATLRALATGHASTSIASLTTVVKREVQASGMLASKRSAKLACTIYQVKGLRPRTRLLITLLSSASSCINCQKLTL